MLAIVYLALSYALGFALCRFFFPNFSAFAREDYTGRPLSVSPLYWMLPAWLYFGVFPLTWAVYLLAVLFARSAPEAWNPPAGGNPLLPANLIAMGCAAALSAFLLWRSHQREAIRPRKDWLSALHPPEIVLIVSTAALASFLMLRSLHVENGNLIAGWSVFSDFTPHLSMLRSFSRGSNFPTVYTVFGGSDVKYHFLYQFLCGNLEFLGLRLDIAFNLPTIIGLLSAVSLLAVFAMKLSGRKGAGALAAGLFLFRSSPSLWLFLAEQPKGGDLWDTLIHRRDFIGYTPNENWGLWNLNVYLNQRHLAFTLGVLLLFVMLYVQVLWDGFRRLDTLPRSGPGLPAYLRSCLRGWFRESLFSKAGWRFRAPRALETPVFARHESWRQWLFPITAGLYIGMIAFWNGAVVIACLLVLFVLALLGDGRLSYLATAVTALALTVLQSRAFIHDSAFSPQFYFGFIAENKTLFGVLYYLWMLTGLVIPLILPLFALSDGKRRGTLLAFSAPLLFAFTVSLTVDPTVNHKYIMISLMLLSAALAGFLAECFAGTRKFLVKAGIGALCAVLMATGVFETVIITNQDASGASTPLQDETTAWIQAHAGHGDLLLTDRYSLNNVLLSGAELYGVWPYYAWSAGYDTAYRWERSMAMYGAESAAELRRIAQEERIAYIVVDDGNRRNDEYTLREDVIAAAYPAVFSTADRNLVIYQVKGTAQRGGA